MLFFDNNTDDIELHAMRIDRLRGLAWGKNLIFLCLCIALMGSGMATLCLYVNGTSEEPLNVWAARALLCLGLAGVFLSLIINYRLHMREWELPESKQRLEISGRLKNIAFVQSAPLEDKHPVLC